MNPLQTIPTFRIGARLSDAGRRVTWRTVWWLVGWAVIMSLPIFLHGCHGDEDNELFVRYRGTSIGLGMEDN